MQNHTQKGGVWQNFLTFLKFSPEVAATLNLFANVIVNIWSKLLQPFMRICSHGLVALQPLLALNEMVHAVSEAIKKPTAANIGQAILSDIKFLGISAAALMIIVGATAGTLAASAALLAAAPIVLTTMLSVQTLYSAAVGAYHLGKHYFSKSQDADHLTQAKKSFISAGVGAFITVGIGLTMIAVAPVLHIVGAAFLLAGAVAITGTLGYEGYKQYKKERHEKATLQQQDKEEIKPSITPRPSQTVSSIKTAQEKMHQQQKHGQQLREKYIAKLGIKSTTANIEQKLGMTPQDVQGYVSKLHERNEQNDLSKIQESMQHNQHAFAEKKEIAAPQAEDDESEGEGEHEGPKIGS